MLTLIDIALPVYSDTDPAWIEFYNIFRHTLNPDITMREFKCFYFFKKPVALDVTFICQDEEPIGFICAAFYHYRFGFSDKRFTIARGTAGVLPGHRGGKMPSFRLCQKYMRYKCRHPFETVYIATFMASPKLYAMMCSYTQRVYPKTGIPETAFIKKLRNGILGHYHRQGEYLVKLHFKVTVSAADRAAFSRSGDRHIRNFIKLNPDYGNDVGLFTLIPLDWKNIAACIWKGLIVKQIFRWKAKVYPPLQPAEV